VRIRVALVLLALPLLTACPALPGPGLTAPLVSAVDPACIGAALERVEGVQWVQHSPSGGSADFWTYGLGDAPDGMGSPGPWAVLEVRRTPAGEVTHRISHPNYQSAADNALSEDQLRRSVAALNRDCGMPPPSTYTRS
jgi:hypothetical protein